jgi:hypothetical protein
MDDRAKAVIVVAVAAVIGIGGVLAVEVVTGFRPGAAPAPSIAGASVPRATATLPTSSQTASTQSTRSVPVATTTPRSTARPKPAIPAPPKAVKVARQGCYTGPDPDGVPPGKCTTTITWDKVRSDGTDIEVYGVTGCLSLEERTGDGWCLVPGTALPPDSRKLIARVPASDRRVSWTGPAWQDVIQRDTGGPTYQAIGVDRHGDDIYFAIVVTASNEAGHSRFIIADAGRWCYDTGCEGP